jgi:hypothetical protein
MFLLTVRLADYRVPVTRDLEDAEIKQRRFGPSHRILCKLRCAASVVVSTNSGTQECNHRQVDGRLGISSLDGGLNGNRMPLIVLPGPGCPRGGFKAPLLRQFRISD